VAWYVNLTRLVDFITVTEHSNVTTTCISSIIVYLYILSRCWIRRQYNDCGLAWQAFHKKQFIVGRRHLKSVAARNVPKMSFMGPMALVKVKSHYCPRDD